MPRKKISKNKKVKRIFIPKFEEPTTNNLTRKDNLPLPLYRTTLKSLGRVYKSEGVTLEEALSKIKISGGAKAVAVLKVEKDGVVKEKILNGAHTNHLFGQGSPTMREISLKWVKELFKDL